jgi:DNA-binding transcriptional LysR family regulator
LIDWDKLRTFHACAETQSLTKAAHRVGLSQSAVSRRIASLEEDLGVPLFHRHARGLIPTGPGRQLQESTREMASIAALAEANLKDARDRPQGELVVTAPVGFGQTWLSPRLGAFQVKFPEVRLRLLLDDREYDLTTLEAECAIRLWQATHADLIQRKILTVRTALYAAPSYLAAHGSPKTLADLDRHTVLAYGAAPSDPMGALDFGLRAGRGEARPREAALKINNVAALAKAVASGFGIGGLPDYLAAQEPGLVKLLPEEPGPTFDVFFIYPADLRRSKRIMAFREFVLDEAAKWED